MCRLLVPERVKEPEYLDLGLGSRDDVSANLAEMDRINRVLGGVRALTRHLYPRLLRHGRPATVADLGTGSADLPRELVRWAGRRGLLLRVLALDWASRNLECAAERADALSNVYLVCADAARAPLRRGQVDYVISSLFLHHFPPEQLMLLLRAAYDLARCGLVMSDLVRGWLPYYAFRLVQPALALNFLTRHDGALSVRRAYTPDELRDLAISAALPAPRVHAHWPWRMTLVVDK
jgi:hypothetical protein